MKDTARLGWFAAGDKGVLGIRFGRVVVEEDADGVGVDRFIEKMDLIQKAFVAASSLNGAETGIFSRENSRGSCSLAARLAVQEDNDLAAVRLPHDHDMVPFVVVDGSGCCGKNFAVLNDGQFAFRCDDSPLHAGHISDNAGRGIGGAFCIRLYPVGEGGRTF